MIQPAAHARKASSPFALAAAASAFVSIFCFTFGPWAVAAVAKPLTTILIILFAWRRSGGDGYTRAVLVGLAASLAGDVLLLSPQRGFVWGLASFLVAHLAYLFAFSGGLKRGFALAPALAYLAAAGIVLALLWPSVPPALRPAVVAYVVALIAMAAMAASTALRARRGAPAYASFSQAAAIGAGLFVVSDATLAINKFAGPVPLASVWVLTTYWFAQWLIASSIGPSR